MFTLHERTRVRKLNPLPLFDWAENNQISVFNLLLITQKLARHLKMSASALNVMAEANGYKGLETDQ